jgi:hypothetical protein
MVFVALALVRSANMPLHDAQDAQPTYLEALESGTALPVTAAVIPLQTLSRSTAFNQFLEIPLNCRNGEKGRRLAQQAGIAPTQIVHTKMNAPEKKHPTRRASAAKGDAEPQWPESSVSSTPFFSRAHRPFRTCAARDSKLPSHRMRHWHVLISPHCTRFVWQVAIMKRMPPQRTVSIENKVVPVQKQVEEVQVKGSAETSTEFTQRVSAQNGDALEPSNSPPPNTQLSCTPPSALSPLNPSTTCLRKPRKTVRSSALARAFCSTSIHPP